MKRSQPLKRTGPLKRTRQPLRRSELRPVSKAQQRKNSRWAKVRVEALVRDEGRCQFPGCYSDAHDVHHRRGRIGPDRFNLDLLVSLCREHHDHVELNRAEAYASGLLLRRNGVRHA